MEITKFFVLFLQTMKRTKFLILLISITIGNARLVSQIKNGYPGKTTRMLFLLDGSGSMVAQMSNTTRWAAAVDIMTKMVDTLRKVENLQVGLRVFGHNKTIDKRDCYDTKLEVPFGPFNHKTFITKLRTIKPLGYTSITQSLLAASRDFPSDKNSRNIIIIITDGVEECPGDPCMVSTELQKKGIILRPFIVGIGAEDEKMKTTYSCAGKYFNANTVEEFNKIIGIIINQSLNNTSVQISLLDNQLKPSETNVPITIMSNGNTIAENLIHTLNGKTNPDTFYLDPIGKYDIVVHTVPQIIKKDVEIVPGKHNTIPIDASQGDLFLQVDGITKYARLQAIVRKHGSTETLTLQDFNSSKRLLTGNYDLEILSTPRIYLNKISILQNQTSKIIIAQPGLLNIKIAKDVVAKVFQVMDGRMVEVCDVHPSQPEQVITMQPGNYKIIYRVKSETRTLYSKTKDITITSATTTYLTL